MLREFRDVSRRPRHPRCVGGLVGGPGEEARPVPAVAGSEVADHPGAIQGYEAGVAVGEVVGEEAAAGAEGVAGPGDVDVDLLDADFEDVAGFGSFDGDGAGEDVASGAFVGGGIVFVDVVNVRGDVGGCDAKGFEALAGAAGGEGLDFYGVSGFDGEDWFCFAGLWRPMPAAGKRSRC